MEHIYKFSYDSRNDAISSLAKYYSVTYNNLESKLTEVFQYIDQLKDENLFEDYASNGLMLYQISCMINSNLSDVENVATARTNLDVYSKSEASALISGGGSAFITEAKTVTADKVVLTNAPKNGVIFNFATVRHVDANFVSYDIPVTVTATAGGKEFLLSPNTSGQFDGKLVQVLYAYTAV